MPKGLKRIMDDTELSITNFTCNGKCSQCGECCNDLLPVSQKEILVIKDYIRKHNIKECTHTLNVLSYNEIDLICPFRDNVNKKCTIYPVRPFICRSFICSKAKPDIYEARELCSKKNHIISMRGEFFGGQAFANILKNIMNKSIGEHKNGK